MVKEMPSNVQRDVFKWSKRCLVQRDVFKYSKRCLQKPIKSPLKASRLQMRFNRLSTRVMSSNVQRGVFKCSKRCLQMFKEVSSNVQRDVFRCSKGCLQMFKGMSSKAF
ncbi:hypothetical protein AVEN_160082-1 [Araneus ventricosus]|uniref:Uncharacterized protein n=1 Tax=Araneus ventricosus TaxID=182803 RepID=A0A4Y2WL70_ARAVE|nr:hypothetical protein AVEN_160082-1 [Araneus ventricosus]